MPFPTINIPLAVGQRQDLTDLATATQDPALQQCLNATFPAEGEITCRRGTATLDGSTLHSVLPGLPAQLEPSLSSEPDLRVGLSEFEGDPVIQCEGRMFRKRGNLWKDTGPFWSMQAEYGPLVGDPNDVLGVPTTFDIDASVRPQYWWPHAGADILAFPSNNPVANYNDNTNGWSVASGTSVVGTIYDSRCVARDVFFTTDGANLKMLRGFPQEVSTTIATDCFVDTFVKSPQRLWAVRAPSGDYYVAYQTNAASVKLLRVNSSGTVLNTLVLTTGILSSASPNLALGIATNGTKIGLVATRFTTTVLTKVINVATWADDAVDTTHTLAGGYAKRPGCSVSAQGVMHVVVSATTIMSLSDYIVLVRFTNAPGFVTTKTLYGYTSQSIDHSGAASDGTVWSGLFPPQILPSGRVVAGVYARTGAGFTAEPEPSVGGCTWLVLDITLDIRDVSLVAAGAFKEMVNQGAMGSADVKDGVLYFSHLVATARTEVSPLATRARLVTLKSSPAIGVNVNSLLLHSGQYPYYLDGDYSFEASYPLPPVITPYLGASPGLTAGNRTITACWAWTDSKGNIHRSAPALPSTIENPSGLQITVDVSLPQWASSRPAKSFNIEIYCSDANPSANADLFTNQRITVPINTLNARYQTVPIVGEPSSLGTALYTGDSILENERPFGNGGVAVVGSRVWCAEGQTVYASKLIKPTEAPAWSSDSSLQLQIPSGYGDVRALGGLDNMLVIVCAEATLVFTGQGPGDAGGPSDFDSPRRVHRGRGPARPSDICETPSTLVWTSTLGEVFAIGPGGGVVDIGKPVQADTIHRPVFLPSTNISGNSIALIRDANGQRVEVLDLDAAQWSTWVFPYAYKDIGSMGSSLVLLSDDYPFVSATTGPDGLDVTNVPGLFAEYALQLITRRIPLGHLGKIRSVKPLGVVSDTGVTVTLEVMLDNDTVFPVGNAASFYVPAAQTTWPRSPLPELRTAVQRCESFAVLVRASPGNIRLTGLQAEVIDGNTMPRFNRG